MKLAGQSAGFQPCHFIGWLEFSVDRWRKASRTSWVFESKLSGFSRTCWAFESKQTYRYDTFFFLFATSNQLFHATNSNSISVWITPDCKSLSLNYSRWALVLLLLSPSVVLSFGPDWGWSLRPLFFTLPTLFIASLYVLACTCFNLDVAVWSQLPSFALVSDEHAHVHSYPAEKYFVRHHPSPNGSVRFYRIIFSLSAEGHRQPGFIKKN